MHHVERVTRSAYRVDVAHAFRESWQKHAVTTSAGELTYTVFPGGDAPFVGCTFVDSRPVAPVEARRLLAEVGHDHAELACLGGDDWTVEPRRGM